MKVTEWRDGGREDRSHQVTSTLRAPRVIVAEDDADVRQLVAVALRGLGYEIIEARIRGRGCSTRSPTRSSGAAPRIVPRPHHLRHPHARAHHSARDPLAGLRQARWPTAIVLMTALLRPRDAEEARRLGADAFFAKPFLDIDDMMTAVVSGT